MTPSRTAAQHPNAIAREVVRELASQRLAATPENYAEAYLRIANQQDASLSGAMTPYAALEALMRQLPVSGRSMQLRQAAQAGAWDRIFATLAADAGEAAEPVTEGADRDAAALSALIQRLLQQLDMQHAGVTLTRKRDGLKRALLPRSESFTQLQLRLTRLMDSWSGPHSAPLVTADADEVAAGDAATNTRAENTRTDLRASFVAQATDIGQSAQASVSQMDQFLQRAGLKPSRHAALPVTPEVANRLTGLLTLLLSNIAELTPDAELFHEQVEQMERVLTAPLTEHKLDEAERTLRALIIRQGAIRHSLDETKTAVRSLVASLIERLATVSASAGSYSTNVQNLAERIAGASSVADLSYLVQSLLSDTQLMSSDMLRARDELDSARQHARQLEMRTQQLEKDLATAAALVRHDPLTDALNRRGFDEIYAAEVSSPRAKSAPLTLALLDIDDFKRINDAFGHAAGDTALQHLTEVLRSMTRPTDAIARHGGEEFALLFPGSSITEAHDTMTRIQRELTKRMFMQDEQRLFITFSCGVTLVHPGEGLHAALVRADEALHRAKREGKNRVRIAVEA